MIAQDVEKVFPDWVSTGEDGYRRLTYRGFEALTVEALRELKQQEEAQLAEESKRRDAENAELKRQNQLLEKRLAALEQILLGLSQKTKSEVQSPRWRAIAIVRDATAMP